MFEMAIAALMIMSVSALMVMTGRGGGNFYVPILIACGIPMLQAATTGQSILLSTAAAALLVFHRGRTIDWKLALVLDPPTDVMALVGGYYAHLIPGGLIKAVFALFLFLSGFLMLRPVQDRPVISTNKTGFWYRNFGKHEYVVNLWLAIPVTALTGLIAGITGISGGSVKVPLMVLACGVPMRIAVGTSTAMIGMTALMGLIGHSAAGDFNASWIIPMSASAFVGGLLGSFFAFRIRARDLKKIFAYTTFGAALFMATNALLSPNG